MVPDPTTAYGLPAICGWHRTYHLVMVRPAILVLCSALSIGCSDPAGDLPPPPRPANPAIMDGEVRSVVELQLAHLEANPGDLEARAQLARLYQANSLPAESIATWLQVLDTDPDAAKHWYCLALAHHGNGDYEAALEAAARSRSLAPAQPAIWWRTAFWELDMGRPEQAETHGQAGHRSGTGQCRRIRGPGTCAGRT